MTEIKFAQSSPRGNAVIDSRLVVVDTDGKAWIVSGSLSAHGLVPASDEHIAALRGHFGKTWDDALAAMSALKD